MSAILHRYKRAIPAFVSVSVGATRRFAFLSCGHTRCFSACSATAKDASGSRPLANTLTLIPGGTRGIGLATAKLFASQGSRIVLLGRDQDRIQRVLQYELTPLDSAEGFGHLGYQCDVSKQGEIEKTIKEVNKISPIDFLIHSAGIARDSLLIAHGSEDMANVIMTNLMGTMWTNKAVAKGMMRQKKGAIINISSVVGIQGNIGQSVYSASKSAIIGFSKSLAKELGSRGVTVNVIAPGYIDTDMTSTISEDRKKDIVSRTSLGRLGTPEDVAEAALFLAKAKFITGQVLVVDGGLSL
ncbi:3-oxoacyl-[acyl-carrier protein] reductase [Entomortierella parvispora]|uniref:3-oxoacyl-[acyl-carrier protein] reductase n=1 Tax=Entomortierella parvispora TaxID=205924 RepID=A0A9P3LRX6_9FUNG|nr:3-oxoacyl-[acyl-carrier protein] reductase [Entomortierella parvispora]